MLITVQCLTWKHLRAQVHTQATVTVSHHLVRHRTEGAGLRFNQTSSEIRVIYLEQKKKAASSWASERCLHQLSDTLASLKINSTLLMITQAAPLWKTRCNGRRTMRGSSPGWFLHIRLTRSADATNTWGWWWGGLKWLYVIWRLFFIFARAKQGSKGRQSKENR